MKKPRPLETVELIPIDRITVINPRIRNRKSFKDIVENVGALGLKKPITVARRDASDGLRYDLVCGQGRLEAYQTLGETQIPAIVRVAELEECLLHSLVENCARRRHDPVELLHDVTGLKQRGYSETQIAEKTGLTLAYVKCVTHLAEKGEQGSCVPSRQDSSRSPSRSKSLIPTTATSRQPCDPLTRRVFSAAASSCTPSS